MKRQLKPEEHEEIVEAIAAGDRVKAKSIYLSATEGNLTEAQNFIESLAESEAAEADSVIKKVSVRHEREPSFRCDHPVIPARSSKAAGKFMRRRRMPGVMLCLCPLMGI